MKDSVMSLSWWKKYLESPWTWRYNALDTIHVEELQSRIERVPMTRRLTKDFLKYHIKKVKYYKKGFLLMPNFYPDSICKFTLFFNPNSEEREIGFFHEVCHGIYKAKGNWLEELIEEEAQRFCRENQKYVENKVNSYL